LKIEKAIEIKLQWRKDNYPPPLADEMNADMMSIEALKRIYSQYDPDHQMMRILLPGETLE